MASNFARARELLAKAKLELNGDDETSWKSRRAIDLLIGAIMTAEYASSHPPAEIISFELAARRRQGDILSMKPLLHRASDPDANGSLLQKQFDIEIPVESVFQVGSGGFDVRNCLRPEFHPRKPE